MRSSFSSLRSLKVCPCIWTWIRYGTPAGTLARMTGSRTEDLVAHPKRTKPKLSKPQKVASFVRIPHEPAVLIVSRKVNDRKSVVGRTREGGSAVISRGHF